MTKTELANLALGHLGYTDAISDITSDTSPEARIIRVMMPTTINMVLKRAKWPFANRTLALAVVEENPTTEWAYAYRVPADCVEEGRIVTGYGVQTYENQVPFERGTDDQGGIIYTDERNAKLQYTTNNLNFGYVPADVVMCMSLLLAFFIAPKLTGGDAFKLGDKAMQAYDLMLPSAKVAAFNAQQPRKQQSTGSVSARD